MTPFRPYVSSYLTESVHFRIWHSLLYEKLEKVDLSAKVKLLRKVVSLPSKKITRTPAGQDTSSFTEGHDKVTLSKTTKSKVLHRFGCPLGIQLQFSLPRSA